MLYKLIVENIAVIETVSFMPPSGLNVLTGETGAGKSILIDSINLILGARTNKDIIRYGKENAKVSAEFYINEAVLDKLVEMNISVENDKLIISREISKDGKSVAKINGINISVAQLKELATYLIDIHGQHDNQALLTPSKHIDFLDSYANLNEEVKKYEKEFLKLKKFRNELETLSQNEQERLTKIDYLKYVAEEISKADLKVGEEESLREELSLIENSEKISVGVLGAISELYDNDKNAYDIINNALSHINGIASFDGKLQTISERLADLLYSSEDIVHELRLYQNKIDFDEQRLDEISQRLDTIKKLERKYGRTTQGCLEYLKSCTEELDLLTNYDSKLEEIEAEIRKTTENLRIIANNLTNARTKAAEKLSRQIENEIRELAMPKAVFEVSINPADEFTSKGMDDVEFIFSANPGQPLRPMAQIASGGELSRIMLAIKTVLSNTDDVPTLIFDEIDTGVSGASAQRIANKLSLLAKHKQIICISHLPQIAAYADNNFKIEKHLSNDETFTKIELLDYDARLNELARIIDGENITQTSLDHAKEMLERKNVL